jgi:hypothetical protein
MNYYNPTYGYRSKFVPKSLFDSADDARAHDRGWAAEKLGRMSTILISDALVDGDREVAELMQFLVEEIKSVPIPVDAPRNADGDAMGAPK